jgi:hypothetical protein
MVLMSHHCVIVMSAAFPDCAFHILYAELIRCGKPSLTKRLSSINQEAFQRQKQGERAVFRPPI